MEHLKVAQIRGQQRPSLSGCEGQLPRIVLSSMPYLPRVNGVKASGSQVSAKILR